MTKVVRAADRPTKVQPASSFVGTVFADEVVVGEKPSRMRATRVTFTPGARTNWHTHPVGQTLFGLSGVGRYQEDGKPVVAINPGDTRLTVMPTSASSCARAFVRPSRPDLAATTWARLRAPV